jgi:hypothetical protein
VDHSANHEDGAVIDLAVAEQLAERLRALRAEPRELASFQVWVKANRSVLSTEMSPGNLLKLSHGNMAKVMEALVNLLPDCTRCGRICQPGPFASRIEHAECASLVDSAVNDEVLLRVKRPGWVLLDQRQLGADAYFECRNCGALWTLVEPERQDNGLWERLS